MTDYNTLSDFEINRRVAHLTGWDPNYWHNLPDYCNNPADAWAVIVENKIGGHYGKASPNFYFAVSRDDKTVYACDNPLRAAMIVFLMMKESEDE